MILYFFLGRIRSLLWYPRWHRIRQKIHIRVVTRTLILYGWECVDGSLTLMMHESDASAFSSLAVGGLVISEVLALYYTVSPRVV